MDKHQTALSIDWLQINCKTQTTKLPKNIGPFKAELQDYSTRHFRSVYIIKFLEKEIATIAMNPHSKILDKDMALVKIDNKQLYRHDLADFVTRLLTTFKMQIKNITRLDVAMDFNAFIGNKNPQKLINGFLSGNKIKLGKAKFKAMGISDKGIKVEYLKFGSETSTISYYLYNKTKELEEVKNKPWIVEHWKLSGLNVDEIVWRLEFSIKSNLLDLIDMESGLVVALNQLLILQEEYLKALYTALINKYWQWCGIEKDTNLSRRKRLQFFEIDKANTVIMRLSEKEASNRMDKIFIKKMLEYCDELRGQDFNNSIFADQLLTHAVKRFDLVNWCHKKNMPINM